MKRKNLYQPFEIIVSDPGDWEENILIYHFFEIVQIIDGEGFREVNENRFNYSKGNIFLFTPLDCRGFRSHTPTKFCSIRFSEVFFTGRKSPAERETISGWLRQLEQIFYQHNRFEKFTITDSADCEMVTGLISLLVTEYQQTRAQFENNLQHFITLILNILARNITASLQIKDDSQDPEPLINKMLLHIKEHIQSKDKLSIQYLSNQFNLSANYVGEYFKKMTGESIQQYITLYKMRLVENKLQYSQLTISQIADDLGFNDESHLSRQFKKHSGHSPVQYRKIKTNTIKTSFSGSSPSTHP